MTNKTLVIATTTLAAALIATVFSAISSSPLISQAFAETESETDAEQENENEVACSGNGYFFSCVGNDAGGSLGSGDVNLGIGGGNMVN